MTDQGTGARRRQDPPQQPPPVQRLRLRYAKRGRLRFTSHRDFSRAFERAVFRARVPMAYSSGFNPHPRISYAGAAPTGAASEAEYVEIALAEIVDPAAVMRDVDQALPPGLDVLHTVESPGGSLSDLLQASHWQIAVSEPADTVAEAVETFRARDEVLVERMTKKGLRTFDARAAVVSIDVRADSEPTVVDVVLRHGTPAVRPDDVLNALLATGAEEGRDQGTGTPALMTRLAQGLLLDDGSIGDPLA